MVELPMMVGAESSKVGDVVDLAYRSGSLKLGNIANVADLDVFVVATDETFLRLVGVPEDPAGVFLDGASGVLPCGSF